MTWLHNIHPAPAAAMALGLVLGASFVLAVISY